MAASGIVVARTVASGLHRAQRTRDIFVKSHPRPPTDNRINPALNEISHGILERQMVGQRHAGQAEELALRIMCILLLERGIESRLIEAFAGWVTPLGYGDGESHLGAGIRVYSAVDAVEARGELDGTAFFGHHGSGRDGRVLGTTFDRDGRALLKAAVAGMSPDYTSAGESILALQRDNPKGIIGRKTLTRSLKPVAAAVAPVIPLLAAAGLPTASDLLNPAYKVPNGSASMLEVREDGRWERAWQLRPQVTEDTPRLTPFPINYTYGPYDEQPPFR